MTARSLVPALAVAVALASGALPSSAEAQTFRRPFACDTCIANFYYFDEDATAGIDDWSCATSSYDGHRGNDFSLRGGNAAVDAGHDVVAGADGTVQSVQDGHFDRCTACGGSGCGTDYGFGFGNHVVIDHGSYKVVYAHMRTGSIRVAPGDRVTCGQAIGQIASSGCSTGAHLHFETRPTGGGYLTAFDPFQGACSATSPSLWVEQGPHRGIPGATCDGSPPTPTCPAGTYPIWTCNTAGTQRRRCIDGIDMVEDCPRGCTVMAVGVDDVCVPPPDADGDGSRADVDCDDGNAAIHPGAADPCGDGVDQDCTGGDALCPGVDGGALELDAGTIDAGATPRGDGAIPEDASAIDATTAALDGGPGRIDMSLSGGCGCRTAGGRAPGSATLLLGALGLATLLARRRKR